MCFLHKYNGGHTPKTKFNARGISSDLRGFFGVGDVAERTFLRLSSGEQRLVLLARAFVKDPALLILDEPLHGLDLTNRRLVKAIIETFCQRNRPHSANRGFAAALRFF